MKIRFITLANGILIFLLIFAFHPQVVLADDGTPTTDESVTVEEAPPPEEGAEESALQDEPEDDESVTGEERLSPDEGTEEQELGDEPEGIEVEESTDPEVILTENPFEDETQSVSTPEQEETLDQQTKSEETQELTPAEVLEQAPEGTQIIVLDPEGQVEPLVSQEAAEIVDNGDPMWCPNGTLPGGAGCSGSYNSFEDLLVDLGGFSGDGTIYVANTYNSALESDDITIDGSVFTTLGALTIQGGWDGALGGDNIVGTSTFDGVSLEVINWGGPITIRDIRILNTLYGLEINTTGAVTLDNVQVTGTTSNNGIGIQAGESVSLNDVDSSSNLENGADITTSNGNIILNDSTFNNNGGLDPLTNTAYGTGVNAEVLTNGNIIGSNVTATGNAEGGAFFNARGSLTLDDSTFSNNTFFASTVNGDVYGGFGLDIAAGTAIDMNNVSASENYLFGADLNAGTTLSISNSNFNNNDVFSSHSIADGFGLDAIAGGNINLSNISASSNYLFGADITSTAGIINLQTGTFSSNLTDSGLFGTSSGLLTVNHVLASNNGNTGAVLESNTGVNVTNSTFNSNSGATYAAGVEIISPGTVTLSNVTANSNQDDGISVSNSPEVYLNNVTVDNNGWDGAYVDGLCSKVFVTDGNFTNNGFVNPLGGYGLEVDNGNIYQSGTPVFSDNFLGAIKLNLDPCFFVPPTTKGDKPQKTGISFTVTSGQLTSLSCLEPVITLITPEDTHATFRNFCNYQVFVFDESSNDLNSRLPVLGLPYYSGVTITILYEGNEISTLPATSDIVISFRTSDEELDQEYAVYHWDGANWIEMSNIRKVYNRVEVITNSVGTFVLVMKQ